jgi:hypothetical protein
MVNSSILNHLERLMQQRKGVADGIRTDERGNELGNCARVPFCSILYQVLRSARWNAVLAALRPSGARLVAWLTFHSAARPW